MAAALGLHVGVGWGLGWAHLGEQAVPMPPGAPAELLWLDGADAGSVAQAAEPAVAPARVAPPARVDRAKAPRARASAAPGGQSAAGAEGLARAGDAPGDAGLVRAGAGGGAAGGSPQPGAPSASVGLSRSAPAHLLATSDPCADLFPYAARSDSGTVAIALDVATNGQPRESHIVEEAPRNQGFALAAHHCVRRLRFAPALDAEGHAVASRSVVRLRFARRAASRS